MKIQIISWDSQSILATYQGRFLPEILGDFADYRDVCETVLDEIDRLYGLTAGQRMAMMRWLTDGRTPNQRSQFFKELQEKRKTHGREKKSH